MSRRDEITIAVEGVYSWVDEHAAQMDAFCRACGRCCDFDLYGHRLFVTSVELIHFHSVVAESRLMNEGACPYRVGNTCSVYEARFAGCRIFTCGGEAESQNRVSEEAVSRFKTICEQFEVPYTYVDLKTALGKSVIPGCR